MREKGGKVHEDFENGSDNNEDLLDKSFNHKQL